MIAATLALAAASLTPHLADPMSTLTALFLAILHISWQAALLALVILAAQYLFRRRLPARWRYALWFLVIARLLMPTLPESPLSLQHYLTAAFPSTTPAATAIVPLANPAASLAPTPALANTTTTLASNPTPPATFPTLALLSTLWLLGIAGFSLSLLLTHRRFLRTLRSTQSEPSTALRQLLADCAAQLKLRSRLRVLESTALPSPAIFGLVRPTLLLPAGFEHTFTPDEQRMILLHELAHVRRGDLLVNALLTALQILHWFNPLLWLAFRRMRFDRECATDALVLSGPRAAQRTLYGHTLLKLVERLSASPATGTPPRLLGILEDKKRLGERFTRIRTATPGAYGWSALGLALLSVIGLTTLTQPITSTAAPADGTATANKTNTPALPANPTRDQVRAYIDEVLKGVGTFGNTTLQDPQIQQLKQVGPENIDLLIEANERKNSGLLGLGSANKNYYLSMTVCELARPEDRDLVVAALPKNRYLVYTIGKMKWAEAARAELLHVFRTEPGKFAPGWIEAIASLHDPALYPELKAYLINGHARSYTYAALKTIPDIGDLQPTVAAAWAIAKDGDDWDLPGFANIAASYDLPGAAALAAAHPFPTEADAKAQVAADQTKLATLRKTVEPTEAAMKGSRLTPEAAEKLSQQIAAEPDRLDLRMELLGYYFRKRALDPAARAAAQPQILWIINNHPASPAAALPYTQIVKLSDLAHYAEAETAWERQVAAHPKDPAILANAASFLQLSDPVAAGQLFRQALAEDPSNPDLLLRFATFLSLQARFPNPQFPDASKEALQIYEKLLNQTEAPTGSGAFYLMTTLTETAYRAGELATAREYAEKLITLAAQYKTDWNYGNAIYTANSILGLIALDAKDIPAAEKHLLAAGATPGSPQLDSFGPDLTLAQKLLTLGKRDTVLTFLDEISTFWKGRESQIKTWQKSIRDGQTPSFE